VNIYFSEALASTCKFIKTLEVLLTQKSLEELNMEKRTTVLITMAVLTCFLVLFLSSLSFSQPPIRSERPGPVPPPSPEMRGQPPPQSHDLETRVNELERRITILERRINQLSGSKGGPPGQPPPREWGPSGSPPPAEVIPPGPPPPGGRGRPFSPQPVGEGQPVPSQGR